MKNINILTRPGGYEGRKVAIMCQIITFPTNRIEHTNGYKNLSGLFKICSSVEACNFYLDTIETLCIDGHITEQEAIALRRIGRQKRLDLTAPILQIAKKATAPGKYTYTPELDEQKPDCQIEASLSYYGTHYFLDTPLDLKGRGITQLEAHWVNGCTKQIKGWKRYQVTKKAFEKLKTQYTISMECLLD